jgi:hypothetical protein
MPNAHRPVHSLASSSFRLERLCQNVILRHSRRICFFVTRWKSRCFAFAQHDIQVICSIVTQSLEAEEMNAVNVANLPETNGKAGLLENYPKI